MFIDRIICKFWITLFAHRIPRILQAATTGGDHRRRPVGAFNKIAGIRDGFANHLVTDQRITASRRNRGRTKGGDIVQRPAPVIEMPVTAIACRVIFDDIAGKHNLLVRDKGNNIAGGMGAAKEHQFDSPFAKMNGQPVIECQRWPCQPGDAFMPLKQPWKPGKLTVPVFLPAFMDHRQACLRRHDFRGRIGRRTKHTHRMVM